MQLTDDGRHLRGEVAGVHYAVLSWNQTRDRAEATKVVNVMP
jgi:hypothetical protein